MALTEPNDAEYRRYKEIKTRFNIFHKKYPLEQIFSHEILRICFQKKWPKAKSVFRWFIIPSPSFIKPCVKDRVVLFSDLYYERKDYKNFLRIIINEIDSPTAVFSYQYKRNIRFVFNFNNIITSIDQVLKRNKGLRITEQIYYAASLTYIKNYLDMLDKYVLPYVNIRSFVAFNSSVMPDSLMTIFFKTNNIPTYSFQHAAYVEYSMNIPMDISNYENVTADKILCWGENAAELFRKYGLNDSRILLAGNPKYKKVHIEKIPDSFGKGLVLLPRYVYDRENIKLIILLGKYRRKYDVDFNIKLHPSLDAGKYKKIIDECSLKLIDKNLLLPSLLQSGEFDFAISYNSTAYYEPMFYGIPVFRFAYHENEKYAGLDDRFETVTELHELIQIFKQKKEDELKRSYQELLTLVFGVGNLNYKILDE
jgi:hypothetical protein